MLHKTLTKIVQYKTQWGIITGINVIVAVIHAVIAAVSGAGTHAVVAGDAMIVANVEEIIVAVNVEEMTSLMVLE